MSDVKSWRDGLEEWPRKLPSFPLDPAKTALLIVDFQYYDSHPDYGLGPVLKQKYPRLAEYFFPKAQTALENTKLLLKSFRAHNRRVLYLTNGPELPDGADYCLPRRAADQELQAKSGNITVFARGSFEHSIRAEVAPQRGELVINKVSTSAFNSTGFDQILRRLGVANLIITGVTTEACVDSTARDAADRSYCCVLVEDACAAWDELTQESTLRTFARCFGMVKTTTEVMEILGMSRQRFTTRKNS